MGGYQINESDIQAVVRHLKITEPENANRNCAIQLLETIHARVKYIVNTDIEFAEELEKELKQRRQNANKQDTKGNPKVK